MSSSVLEHKGNGSEQKNTTKTAFDLPLSFKLKGVD